MKKAQIRNRVEIWEAKKEWELASARALWFVAAAQGPVPDRTIEIQDPWRLALLRMVNCLGFRAPQMAHEILLQALRNGGKRT